MRAEAESSVKKTTEDYLEAILIIREKQGYVRSVDVADQLGVTKPSVTYTVKRLKENGYITNDHAGMLVLTESGESKAQEIYDRHKTLTSFFIALGVSAEQAQTDACKIEHDISEETYQALCRHAKSRKIMEEQR
ncbi:MAG: metal-dependent transcriptional regulator [Anaerovoracaceae bacterium]|jgi:DtxR family Mn-dependent transcriptional regulator